MEFAKQIGDGAAVLAAIQASNGSSSTNYTPDFTQHPWRKYIPNTSSHMSDTDSDYENPAKEDYSCTDCSDDDQDHDSPRFLTYLSLIYATMFHFKGVICRHVLSAYRQLGRTHIPGDYVLSRWCNNLSRTNELQYLDPNLDDMDYVGSEHLYTTTHGKLLGLILLCGANPDIHEILNTGLDHLKEAIIDTLPDSGDEAIHSCSDAHQDVPIKDPKHVKSVGRPLSVRFKPGYEPSSSKKNANKSNNTAYRRSTTGNLPKSPNKVGVVSRTIRSHELTVSSDVYMTYSHMDTTDPVPGSWSQNADGDATTHTGLLLTF